MTLGEELRELSTIDLENEIFKKLKKEFRSLAKDVHEGGCILRFRDIDTKTKNSIIQNLKNEEISVYDNIIIDNVVQTDVFLLVWNRIVFEEKILKVPSPCIKCDSHICAGCARYIEYLITCKKTYIKNNISEINIYIKDNKVCIE